MKIILGADHGGFEMKKKLKVFLTDLGYKIFDVGAFDLNTQDDFVDYAVAGSKEMEEGDRLILLCRNGVGMSIVANRYKNVRCVLGFDEDQIEKARSDDDVNCLSLPADYVNFEKACLMVNVFLNTKFSFDEERFVRRIKKMGEVVVN
jgi:RpiB/LacA/LacB family sugar-phosphate isomerase